MNYHGITKSSLVNGEGIRVVLWVSGCSHHCDGCQNDYTWDPDSGQPFTGKTLDELLDAVKKPYIDGLTISGGDPMYRANRDTVRDIARTVKLATHKSIWLYTGYLWEEIKDSPVMAFIDVVIDGKYQKDCLSATYRGSCNQRIINVKEMWKK